MKCSKFINPIPHRSWCVTKDRSRTLGRGALSKESDSLPHQLSTTGGSMVAHVTHLGKRVRSAWSAYTLGDLKATRNQSCHKLAIGNWNITYLKKRTNWSWKPKDIPQTLLASHRQSVVVLKLFI